MDECYFILDPDKSSRNGDSVARFCTSYSRKKNWWVFFSDTVNYHKTKWTKAYIQNEKHEIKIKLRINFQNQTVHKQIVFSFPALSNIFPLGCHETECTPRLKDKKYMIFDRIIAFTYIENEPNFLVTK